MCVKAISYFERPENEIIQYKDYSYGCNDGYYLSFYHTGYGYSKIACLTQSEINDSMYQVYGKEVYTNDYACGIVLAMVPWKDDTTQLCVTRQICE